MKHKGEKGDQKGKIKKKKKEEMNLQEQVDDSDTEYEHIVCYAEELLLMNPKKAIIQMNQMYIIQMK